MIYVYVVYVYLHLHNMINNYIYMYTHYIITPQLSAMV